ncbi:MAG: hypothetical protein Faunusvirus2_43 [Faunusvirus sp.]|jgi:ankyrin repeat protein|uniref:Uncharacterized protein n=1 Tax=Faunusvirus sp. TaxID=2487766 RepID=A0A3G4ZW36_9VIRU|nr:MAG: hypothetical protein Faunusvirus2_43 [Faunusvirus sp.]
MTTAIITAYDHARDFVDLFSLRDEMKCIEYIDKYNDFYNTNINAWTPLMYAIFYRKINVISKLIHKGADINYRTVYNRMPLMIACEYGTTEIVIMLIKAGAYFVGHAGHEGHEGHADILDTHIVKYNHFKIMQYIRDVYRQHIISVINDDISDNALAVSFRTTYASGVVDMISEFII